MGFPQSYTCRGAPTTGSNATVLTGYSLRCLIGAHGFRCLHEESPFIPRTTLSVLYLIVGGEYMVVQQAQRSYQPSPHLVQP